VPGRRGRVPGGVCECGVVIGAGGLLLSCCCDWGLLCLWRGLALAVQLALWRARPGAVYGAVCIFLALTGQKLCTAVDGYFRVAPRYSLVAKSNHPKTTPKPSIQPRIAPSSACSIHGSSKRSNPTCAAMMRAAGGRSSRRARPRPAAWRCWGAPCC